MKNSPDSVRELISSLADDRLEGEELAQLVDRLGADDALQATWRTYHAVGDVLRAGRSAPCSDGGAFLARFQERLAAEPALVRPTSVPAVAAPVIPDLPREAANEPVFRWKLIAGAASLAAAAAIGWNWVGSGLGTPPVGAQMAQQSQPAQLAPAGNESSVLAALQGAAVGSGSQAPTRVVVGNDRGSAQVMLRDPRLDQLLEAHRQASGGAQMPSGFLRNATFEGAAR
ncbi:MAG: anti-sigma factor [Variovorax sp.]|nr:MAG: anti-sigma factor [Variovorax sp.]